MNTTATNLNVMIMKYSLASNWKYMNKEEEENNRIFKHTYTCARAYTHIQTYTHIHTRQK